jgi:hypothetical protein
MEGEGEADATAEGAETVGGVGAILHGEGVGFGAGVEAGDEEALEGGDKVKEVISNK